MGVAPLWGSKSICLIFKLTHYQNLTCREALECEQTQIVCQSDP